MSKERAIFQSVKAATVSLVIMTKKDDGTCPFYIVGSGFCVDSIGIIITCRHVLSAFMSQPIEKQINGFEEIRSEKGVKTGNLAVRYHPYVIFYRTDIELKPDHFFAIPTRACINMAKTDFDLAMIRVTPHNAFPRGFPFLEIEDYKNIYEGDEIATCGFPLGNYLQEQLGTITSSFTKGIVSSIIPASNVPQKYLKGFQLNLTATHGNSGGPVFSLATGKVFGVLQGGVVDHERKPIPNLIKAEPVYPVLEYNSLAKMKEMKIPKTEVDCAALIEGCRKNLQRKNDII